MNINISRNEILNEVERRISVESSIIPEKYDLLWVNTNKKELLKGYWIEGCESVVSLFKRYLDTETISHTLTSESTDETFVIDVTMPGKRQNMGYKHPLSVVLDELKEIQHRFVALFFKVAKTVLLFL